VGARQASHACLNAGATQKGARSTFESNNAKRAARWYTRQGGRVECVLTRGLTFEFTCWRKRAEPAVASQVQRRVSPRAGYGHGEPPGRSDALRAMV